MYRFIILNILFLFKYISSSSAYCDVYKCAWGNEPTTCLSLSTSNEGIKTYSVRLWKDGNFCQLNDAKERGICQPKPRLNFLPGFKCENNTDCLSNNCFNHTVCQGLPEGAQCSSHQYCDVGLFCNSGNKCQLQKDLNSPCFHDVECVNNAGCYKGFCTQYLSLPKGEEIVDYSNQI